MYLIEFNNNLSNSEDIASYWQSNHQGYMHHDGGFMIGSRIPKISIERL